MQCTLALFDDLAMWTDWRRVRVVQEELACAREADLQAAHGDAHAREDHPRRSAG